jgi:DNA-binding transcriptional ArsR family regulator
MLNAQIVDVSDLLKSMGHPIRLKILCLLRENELPVGELQAKIQTTNGNISQHLAILRNQGIIACRKDANFIYNSISDPRVLLLMGTLKTLFCDAEEQGSSTEGK